MKKIILALLLTIPLLASASCTTKVANIIYREGRAEGYEGMLRVGSVIMNRAAREHISPCKVLANTKQWSKVRVEPQADYAIAKALAIKLVLGAIKPVHTATYFHATWLAKKPYWVANLTLVGTWGQHSYYKEKVHGKTS